MYVDGCVSCDTLVGKIKPPSGLVYENGHWIVFLRYRPMVLGYSFIVLKRHCEHLAELTPEEALTFGPIMQKTCLALSRVLQPKPAKIYVSSWGEGVKHIHFHVLPRAPKMPAGNRPVSLLLLIYGFLNKLGLKKAYSNEEVAKVAEQVRMEFQGIIQEEEK